MNTLSKDEYLKMLEDLADEQYGSDSAEVVPVVPEESWIPAESPALEKLRRSMTHGVIDVTNLKRAQIQEALYRSPNIAVGDFLLHIDRYHGYPEYTFKGKTKKTPTSVLTLDISLMETKYQTPSGAPCKMSFKIDPNADSRFHKRAWLSYFSHGRAGANDVPVETVVDIIKWLQALKKIPAFL